ncbi:MAG: hypothetical protein K9J13_08150, partial [Saprospiraceae bacterium]|nr:hypothetical protein [Saprospiraceae bacterium]
MLTLTAYSNVMKILKSLIYFIIIMIAVSCSPTKKICDKWELNNGIVIWEFNENNDFIEYSIGFDTIIGKWILNNHYLEIITKDSIEDFDTLLIESISKNKLILTDSANPKFTIHLKSYKPLNRNCNVEEIKNFLISNTLLYKSRIHKRPFLKKRIEFLDNGKCILNDFYNYMYDWKVVEFEGNYFVIIDYWFEQEIYKITNIKKNRLNFIGNLKSNNYSFKCSFVKEKIRDNIIDENQLIGNWSVVTDSLIILNYPDNSISQLKKKYQKKIEKGKKYRDEEIIVFDESEIEEELDGVLNTQDYDTIVDEEIVLYSQNCDTIVEEDIVLNTHLNEPPPPPPPLQDST